MGLFHSPEPTLSTHTALVSPCPVCTPEPLHTPKDMLIAPHLSHFLKGRDRHALL